MGYLYDNLNCELIENCEVKSIVKNNLRKSR